MQIKNKNLSKFNTYCTNLGYNLHIIISKSWKIYFLIKSQTVFDVMFLWNLILLYNEIQNFKGISPTFVPQHNVECDRNS